MRLILLSLFCFLSAAPAKAFPELEVELFRATSEYIELAIRSYSLPTYKFKVRSLDVRSPVSLKEGLISIELEISETAETYPGSDYVPVLIPRGDKEPAVANGVFALTINGVDYDHIIVAGDAVMQTQDRKEKRLVKTLFNQHAMQQAASTGCPSQFSTIVSKIIPSRH